MKPFSLALTFLLTIAASAQAQTPNAAGLDVSDLPIVEARATSPVGQTIALFISGDGGWAKIDRGVTAELNASGISVIGLDSRAYLRQEKTPERAAADVGRLARAYMARWNATSLVLVGYSRGADMMPFVINRLPADLRARTVEVALLGLAPTVNFHFHWQDIVRDVKRADDRPTAPELARVKAALPAGARVMCVYGTNEDVSGCRDGAAALGVLVFSRPGGHDLGGDTKPVGALVVGEMPKGSIQ